MRLRDMGVRTKLIGQGAISTLLIVVVAALSMYSLRDLSDAVRMVYASHKATLESLEISQDALSMQTGMRGFLLTGEDKFLDAFRGGEKQISHRFATLKKMIRSKDQKKELSEAEETVSQWKGKVADFGIALRREVGASKDMNDMAGRVRKDMANQYLVKLRLSVESFIEDQQARLAKSSSSASGDETPGGSRQHLALAEKINASVQNALQLLLTAEELQRTQLWFLLSGQEEFLDAYRHTKKRLFDILEKLKASVPESSELKRPLEEGTVLLNEWIRTILEPQIQFRTEIAGSKKMGDIKAYIAKGEDKIYFDKFKQLMSAFETKQDSLMVSRQEVANSTARRNRELILVGTVLLIGVGLLYSLVVAGSITKPLEQARELATAISDGDLTRTLRVKNKDEIGRLCESLNTMVEKLRNQIRNILDGTRFLGDVASDMGQSVNQVATSAQETNAAVVETSATVAQVRQAAKLAMEQGKNVAGTAAKAMEVSSSGARATRDTIEKINLINSQMESIGELVTKLANQSEEIGAIVDTVQDLADQSNLLAVNASIEAARAGDQGRAFSVVAHEIKVLADQSRGATGKIDTILADTETWISAVVRSAESGQRAVREGMAQSEVAGGAIEALSRSVTESAQAAGVIKATSEQQAAGVDQVSSAIGQIETAMGQISEGTAQLEGSAARLRDLSSNLQRLAAAYRL